MAKELHIAIVSVGYALAPEVPLLFHFFTITFLTTPVLDYVEFLFIIVLKHSLILMSQCTQDQYLRVCMCVRVRACMRVCMCATLCASVRACV